MILSTSQELNALLPANVSTSPERLLALVEQTERTYIIPLLGKPLYQAVCQEYASIHRGEATDAEGNAIEVNDLVVTESHHMGFVYTPMQQLIRLLQVPLVYMTLANNTGILSVSLNDGGMNMVSAESYDAAKKDDREAFSRDCYLNAHKGMEQVLLFLEEDAHVESPVFLKLWSQSATFYLQYGLLVTTATCFNRFVPIDDSREMFLSLVQRIRYIQESKLTFEFGDTLINALVQYAAFGPQSNVATTSEANPESTSEETLQNNSQFSISNFPFTDDLRPFLPVNRYPGMTIEERIKLNAWNRLLLLLQRTICFYVEMDNKKLRRPDSDKDAMLSLEQAKTFVQNNTAFFEGVIEDSPLFQPDSEATLQQAAQRPCTDKQSNVERINQNSDSVVFDPLGSFYP